MSKDSGGNTAIDTKEQIAVKNKSDEELEDGELDTDDDEDIPIPSNDSKKDSSNKQISPNNKSSSTNKASSSSSHRLSRQDDNKSSKSGSSSSHSNKNRKRRRSNSQDSSNSDKRRRSNAYSSKIRNQRHNTSTDEDQDSDDEDVKIDPKMMMSMLKQMQEFFKNTSDVKINKHNKQEMDRMFEKMKNNKGDSKEIMRLIKKNKKMLNSSSQETAPAIFSSTFNNPNFNGTPYVNLQPNYVPPLISGPGFSSTFNPLSYNSAFPSLNLNNNNSNFIDDRNLSNNQNKKNKKRKKGKQDDRTMMKQDEGSNDESNSQIPKMLCKYFIEGHCQKGSNCDFIHQQPYNYKKEVCKFYLQDSCGKGDNCTFLHKEFPCKLYHNNLECIVGDNCKFSHEQISDEMKEIFYSYLENNELNEELNQAYGLGLSKNMQKKPPILGDVPEEVKNSYKTFVWQQEMKKLEIAYTGTKRNLFCIEDEFVVKEKQPSAEDLKQEDQDNINEFNFEKDIDERQMNTFFIDTVGDKDLNVFPSNQEKDENYFRDADLRNELSDLNTTSVNNENQQANFVNAILNDNIEENLDNIDLKSSLEEVKNQWLVDESDDELDKQDNNKKDTLPESNKSNSPNPITNIDISKMLDAIRQTTNNNLSNSSTSNNKPSEFWKNILNGVSLSNENPSPYFVSSTSVPSVSSQLDLQESITNQNKTTNYRDPRLAKQRKASFSKINHPSSSIPSSTTSNNNLQVFASLAYKIPPEESFTWSRGDVTFKLYTVDTEKINYMCYKNLYEKDPKLKSDPRLQKYFNLSINYQTDTKDVCNYFNPSSSLLFNTKSSTSSSKASTTASNLLTNFPPLTLSNKPKNEASTLIPPPPPPLSAFELISSSKSSSSYADQLNSSLSKIKQDASTITIPQGGLSGLANLVTEKSKRNLLNTDLNATSLNDDTIFSKTDKTFIDKIEIKLQIKNKKDEENLDIESKNDLNEDNYSAESPQDEDKLTIMEEEPLSPKLVIESDTN